MKALLSKLIRLVNVTGPADNEKQFPVQQISYLGKEANAFIVFPYGLYGNISSTDVLGVTLAVDGHDENKCFIGGTPEKRPRDLQQNEVALYHPFTKTFVKFRNNGNIEIDTNQEEQGQVIINTTQAEVNVQESVTINAETLTANISGSVTFDTPTVTFTGDIEVQGASTLSATVTSGGTDISNTHTHQGSPTAPSGPQTPTGTPV